jgi:predicted MFS family arabinose efflux permease
MQHWGWRATLTCAGVPGLVLTLLFLRATAGAPPAPKTPSLPPLRAIASLWCNPAFCWLALACGLVSISGYAGLAFVPSFLERSHGLSHAQTGLLLAGLTGVIGFFGTMLPGLLARRLGGDGLRICMITTAITLPFHALIYLGDDMRLVVLALTVSAFFASSWLGPALAAAQNMVSPDMRAQTAALLLAAMNLIGMAVGPQMTGIISDLLHPALGVQSLRYALLCNLLPALAAVACFAAARRRTRAI